LNRLFQLKIKDFPVFLQKMEKPQTPLSPGALRFIV